MAYGTAPHKDARGRWVTQDGRVLTPAGQAYWENHHRQGYVTADGHTTAKARSAAFGRAIDPTRPVLPAPPPPRPTRGQPNITRPQWRAMTPTQKMGTQVTYTLTPRERAALKRKQDAQVAAAKAKGYTVTGVPAIPTKVNQAIGFGGASGIDQRMAALDRAEAAAKVAYAKAHPPQPSQLEMARAYQHDAQGRWTFPEAHAKVRAWNEAAGPNMFRAVATGVAKLPYEALKAGGQTMQDIGVGITRSASGGRSPVGTPEQVARAQNLAPHIAKTVGEWTIGPSLTALGMGGHASLGGIGLDAAMLIPALKPIKGLKTALRAGRAAADAAKTDQVVARITDKIIENRRQLRLAIANPEVEQPVIDALNAEHTKLTAQLDAIHTGIPERQTQIEQWKRMGFDDEKINAFLAWHDNQASKFPAGPRAWWQDRVGHPSGETAAENVARAPKALHQAAPEPHVPHPETREAAVLKASQMPKPVEIFKGVDMSVFREHDIDSFLKKIPEYLRRGSAYRWWYEDSGKAILRYANGDKELANRIAQVVAIYSASRQPRENINLAMQALREYEQTGRITIGRINKWKGMEHGVPKPADQADKAMMVMRGEDWGGRKTNRFYANMLKWIDSKEVNPGGAEGRYEDLFKGGEVTNDIWMARLFGLKSDVPTPREYDAMTKITQNIAAKLGWSPEEIQAALWVPAKADAGRTVTGKGGKKIRVALGDHEAGMDFARALDQEGARAAIEVAPGQRAAPELFAAYQAMTPEMKRAHFEEHMAALTQFLRDSKIFGEISGEGWGVWKNNTNPAMTISIPLGTGRAVNLAGKKAAISTVLGIERKVMDGVLSHVSEALHQDAFAWFRPIYRREPISKQNGTLLQLSRGLTEDETLRFKQALDAHFGGDIPIPPGKGNDLYVLNFSGTKNAQFHDDVLRILAETTSEGGHLHADQVPFRFDGGYKTRSQYAAAARRVSAHDLDAGRGFAGRPDVQEAARRYQARVRGINDRYLGRADDLTTLHQTAPGESLPRGATEFLPGGRSRVHYFEKADVSTVMHELFHTSLQDLRGAHLKTLADEYAGGKALAEWTRDEHEAVASAFEQWLRTGEVTNPKLKGPFQAIKDWMLQLFGKAKAEGLVPADVEEAFNYMFREADAPLERQALAAAKRSGPVYEAQAEKRTLERAQRLAGVDELRAEAGGGLEGHQSVLGQLSGEYYKAPFADLTHLEDHDVSYLINAAHATGRLDKFDMVTFGEAIRKAQGGEVLTPSDAKVIFKAFAPGSKEAGRTPWETAKWLINEIVNIPRSIMASGDVSGVFRQALVAFAMHPLLVTKEMGPMFKYLWSEKKYLEDMRWLANDPKAQLMMAHGTEFTDLRHGFTNREEQFMSSFAEIITGGKHGIVRRSGRAYTGLLNNVRYALNDQMYRVAARETRYDAFLRRLGRDREVIDLTGKELDDISTVANWATGRGHLGGYETQKMLLNTFLFSPRLLKSRIDLLNPVFYARLSPVAQRHALRGAVSLALGGASVLGMAKLAGTDVVLDPYSSDFGKIKVGNHRFDIWGGQTAFVRTLFQEIGHKKTVVSTGESRPQHQFEPFWNFMRGKLSPPVGLTFDVAKGKNIIGEKVPTWKTAYEHLTPLAWQDAIESYLDDNNIGWGAAGFVAGQLGVGIQTFAPKAPSGGGGGGDPTDPWSGGTTDQGASDPWNDNSAPETSDPWNP